MLLLLLLLPPCSDFDEMEQLFSQQINPNLDMEELDAMCTEFKNDYNQKHFVRNETFKAAAESIQGEHHLVLLLAEALQAPL
jgi:magnesium-protoporphyrin IX monomethyl ester (oxidative) cyclase